LQTRKNFVRDMKVRGSVGCSVHKKVEFRIPGGESRVKSKITALDFRRADLKPLQGCAWKNTVECDPGEKMG